MFTKSSEDDENVKCRIHHGLYTKAEVPALACQERSGWCSQVAG